MDQIRSAMTAAAESVARLENRFLDSRPKSQLFIFPYLHSDFSLFLPQAKPI